jgi:hypothetical protein
MVFTVSNESEPNTVIEEIDAGGGGAAPNSRGGQRLGVAVGRCKRATQEKYLPKLVHFITIYDKM